MAWLTLGGWVAAMAQERSNIVELTGDAYVNGRRLAPEQTLQTGDQIETGAACSLVFVIGDAAFQMRPHTVLTLERGNSLATVSQLRLQAGAVASVWGASSRRQIVTPHLSADFESAGVYAQVSRTRQPHSYLCNCYGTLVLSAGRQNIESTSAGHEAFWAAPESSEGGLLMPADSINHTDKELELLARLLNQKTPWQASGEK
ncbi:MAG: iron dicitrate transport regulator FecR [Pseudomonadota bacterium]|nr:iron dicitrate transport regulator FecR [Pseudomonadota bacterium]